MNAYKIYFQIYGKKLVVTVCAENVDLAKDKVRRAVQFDKIVEIDADELQSLKDLFVDVFK